MIVDLAIEEPVPQIPRTTNYCRFAISDDGENDPATLRAAFSATCCLAAGGQIVLVCCNPGLNRSPSLAAIVLADQTHSVPTAALETISRLKQIDVNPALWWQIVSVYSQMTALTDR